jgi:hypothetical protein
MRAALDTHPAAAPPTPAQIVERIGPLANSSPESPADHAARSRTRTRNRLG